MTDQLLDAVRRVQADIVNHPNDFQNEQQTIRSLIDPILNALGWDPNDRARVQHEYPVGNKRVDMALMRNGKPVALIEAKALGFSFGQKEIDQVSGYCFREGVQTALLTNGAEWRIYRPQQLGKLPFEQRQLFQVQLGGDEETVDLAVRQLSRLAYEVIDRLEDESWRILLESYWGTYVAKELFEPFTKALRKSFARQIEKKTFEVPLDTVRTLLREKLSLKPQQPLRRAQVREQQSHQHRIPEPSPPDTGRAVILDGERIVIEYKNQALIETAEWLIRRGKLNRADCPVTVGRQTRYLIHTKPKHEKHFNKEFSSSKRLSNGLYLEVWQSHSAAFIRRVYQLLEHFDYRPDTLQLIGFDD